jgi:hypothetical protein
MKFIKALLLFATIATAPISPAFASSKVEIMGANYGGSGCPAQSASVSVSPDGQELSILFDKFSALGNDPSQSRKSCNLSIPISVPNTSLLAIAVPYFNGLSKARKTIPSGIV